ncbi:MAG: transposase [Candidatus Cloacimonetes bacterium]|nr:transposase [Candidatus Cloacimonadota bacterium]
MEMDNASWYSAQSMFGIQNIKPPFLPPEAPELNPVECIWHHIKKRHFSNILLNYREEVEQRLVTALAELNQEKTKMSCIQLGNIRKKPAAGYSSSCFFLLYY